MSATASSSFVQLRANSSLTSLNRKSVYPQSSIVNPLSRGGKARVAQCAAAKKSTVLEKRFFGNQLLRLAGSERVHLWQSDGPGKSPKLRVVVRSALSGLPEKPLGLYDPKFDKDSCGVGFVAELSGESSRKTVRFGIYECVCVLFGVLLTYYLIVMFVDNGCFGNVGSDDA